MAHIEIESFIFKFRNLCHAGIKASLSYETENGEAFISLKAGLPSSNPSFHGHGQPRVHRGPAYHRRQVRRREAAAAAGNQSSEAAEAPHEKLNSSPKVFDAAEKVVDINMEDVRKNQKEKRQDSEKFECEICDFSSNWSNGLKVHLAKKHSKIEQIDGLGDGEDFDDEKYKRTRHYWKEGRLGTVYQTFLDANELIDELDISEEAKKREKMKILESRKSAFGNNFQHFPPWDKL